MPVKRLWGGGGGASLSLALTPHAVFTSSRGVGGARFWQGGANAHPPLNEALRTVYVFKNENVLPKPFTLATAPQTICIKQASEDRIRATETVHCILNIVRTRNFVSSEEALICYCRKTIYFADRSLLICRELGYIFMHG